MADGRKRNAGSAALLALALTGCGQFQGCSGTVAITTHRDSAARVTCWVAHGDSSQAISCLRDEPDGGVR